MFDLPSQSTKEQTGGAGGHVQPLRLRPPRHEEQAQTGGRVQDDQEGGALAGPRAAPTAAQQEGERRHPADGRAGLDLTPAKATQKPLQHKDMNRKMKQPNIY